MSLKQSEAWISLSQHRRMVAELHLRDLFEKDPHRFRRFSLELDGLLLDYSKNLITEDTLRLLLDLAAAADLVGWRQRLLQGEVVNHTEGRPALHTALRSSASAPLLVQGKDVRAEVREVLARMEALAEAVRNGRYLGY